MVRSPCCQSLQLVAHLSAGGWDYVSCITDLTNFMSQMTNYNKENAFRHSELFLQPVVLVLCDFTVTTKTQIIPSNWRYDTQISIQSQQDKVDSSLQATLYYEITSINVCSPQMTKLQWSPDLATPPSTDHTYQYFSITVFNCICEAASWLSYVICELGLRDWGTPLILFGWQLPGPLFPCFANLGLWCGTLVHCWLLSTAQTLGEMGPIWGGSLVHGSKSYLCIFA